MVAWWLPVLGLKSHAFVFLALLKRGATKFVLVCHTEALLMPNNFLTARRGEQTGPTDERTFGWRRLS